VTRTQLDGPRTPSLDLRTRWSVQQRSTATTALSNTFGFIQMRPGQRKQGYERLLRGVRDEEVAGSNPVTPTSGMPGQIHIEMLDRSVRAASTAASQSKMSPSRRNASRVAAELAYSPPSRAEAKAVDNSPLECRRWRHTRWRSSRRQQCGPSAAFAELRRV
jgi:hypothetical protein